MCSPLYFLKKMPSHSKFNLNKKMVYNIDWVIPSLRNPSKLWYFASTITVAAVGLFTKIFIGKFMNFLT